MILVIDKSQKNANDLADMFYYMGVLAKAVSVKDALSEISDIYRAVILISPEDLSFPEDIIEGLKSYSNAPLFAIGSPKGECVREFLRVFEKGTHAPTLLSAIRDCCDDMLISAPGDYNIAGVDISATTRVPVYFWTPLPFTRTESMIIRYLIRAYPSPAPAEDILKYAFRDTRRPEVASVRTHVSIINKKFREATGKTNYNFIETAFGQGYRILTPEIAFASK